MNRRPSLSTAAWLFLLTFGVRLYVLIRLSLTPFFLPNGGDMKFYNEWAMRIAHGTLTDHQAFYGLPGYPYWLALWYRLLGGDIFSVCVAAGIIQGLADGATTVFIWKIAREAFPGKPGNGSVPARAIGIMAALGWALFQPSQTFSAVLMPTALAVAGFWFCVWQFMRRRTGPPSIWSPWLPLGLFIGVETMVVATILFVAPLGISAIFTQFCDTPGKWAARSLRMLAASGLLLGGILAGASPCWIHNYFVAREPVLLSAHSGLNFYIGNNAIATGYPKLPPGMSAGQQGMLKDSITIAETESGRPLKHYEVSRFWSAKAHAYIAAHPGEWLRLMGRKFANFWNDYQYDDLSLITLFSRAGVLLPGLRFGWVAAVAIPGLILALLRRREAVWIAAAVLLHMAALMPVFVTERYRLAAVPGLLLLAAYGIREFWNYLCEAKWGPALGYAAAGAAAGVLIAIPPADHGLWSLDYYNTGIKAMDAGDFETAQRELQVAYRYVPDNSEINFALGLLWQHRDNIGLAQNYYRRALEINPRHASAWNNLGVLAGKKNAWGVALKCFDAAAALEPEDVKARYSEARAYAELGRWQEAKTAVDAALRMGPQREDLRELAVQIDARKLSE